MKILVVGGAGYVGSHTCLALHEAGCIPIVYDNLSGGYEEFVQWGAFEKGDILDGKRLTDVIEKHQPAAIIHFAGSIEVGESVTNPVLFYRNNVAGSISLFDAAIGAGVKKFVFSSTCATYGNPVRVPMDETHPQEPINPYGRTKLMVEQILSDLDQYVDTRSVCLRYFNAAGADFEGRIGEAHSPETHAVPLTIEAALGLRDQFYIFGTDYGTRDGSCVRDYVHVLDLADAHVCAVKHLLDGGESLRANLGTGEGTSVRELIDTVQNVSGRSFKVVETDRRAGDASILVANNSFAEEMLGWEPRYGVREIVETAWTWHHGRNASRP